MTSLYVKLTVRAIMNFPGSHGYSIIKNLLALPIEHIQRKFTKKLVELRKNHAKTACLG